MGIRKFRLASLAIFLLALLAARLPLSAQESGAQKGPGQKGRIAALRVTGAQKYAEAQVIAAGGLKPGDVVSKDEIQAAADRLAQLGPFSRARYRFTSSSEGLTVEFQVEEAPTVPVSFDNFAWFTDAELTEALRQSVALFDGTAPEQGTILDAMTVTLQKLLATRGVQATVERTLMAEAGGDTMMQQFKAVGASLKVNGVQLGDALAAESRRVQERLSDVVGKPYSRFVIEVFALEQVRPVYFERGHLRVRFGKPQARFTGSPDRPLPDSVLVILPIEPGPAYRWGEAEWRGNTVFPAATLNQFLGLKADDMANGTRIAGAWLRLTAEYGRRGYLDAKLEPAAVFDDAAQRVAYRVAITEGPQYSMGDLVITGLSLAAERKLAEAWRVPRGQVFDRVYFEDFLATGVKQAFGELPVHYTEVGHWLRSNPVTRTVDVLLDFK